MHALLFRLKAANSCLQFAKYMIDSVQSTADIGHELTSGYISFKGLRILIIFVFRKNCLLNFSYGKSKFLSITSYYRFSFILYSKYRTWIDVWLYILQRSSNTYYICVERKLSFKLFLREIQVPINHFIWSTQWVKF